MDFNHHPGRPIPLLSQVAEFKVRRLPLEAQLAEKKKNGLFDKIENRDEALKLVRDASIGFFILAAIQGAASFLLGSSLLIDAALYVVGGFFLFKFRSRTAAVLLLLLACLGAGVTIANKMGANLGGGGNVILSLIVLVVAARAVEATFKLRGRFAEKPADHPSTPA